MSQQMKRLAIITARGGSKRIPRKNIKEFLGKPILAYSIEAALQSGLFDEVMVSTDDEEIAQIAKSFGASVPFYRSEKTSGDFATTADVLLEVLDEYHKKVMDFEVCACIYPTAPFVTSAKLQSAMDKLLASDADTLISVVPFSYPPKRGLVIRNDRLVFEYPEFLDTRSQDIEKSYHDAGQFYLFRVPGFLKNQKLMTGNILPFELSELEVQDIDNMVDWELAELKYRFMVERNGAQA